MVKKGQLRSPSSEKTTLSNNRKGALDVVRGGKEGLSIDVGKELTQALIRHKSGVAYTQN